MADSPSDSKSKSPRVALILGAAVFSTVVLVVAIEIASRAAFAFQDELKTALGAVGVRFMGTLDEYKIPDPNHAGNWLLKPGYRKTLSDVIDEKRREGKVLAVEYLTDLGKKYRIAPDEPLLQINREGFKGPEIDKTHSRLRILTIGDSCTFGTYFDKFSYPRVLERALSERGYDVEVINGGVEGYAPKNVSRYRIEEFKGLKPDITTIYIGWNALYAEDAYVETMGLERYFYSVRLFRKAVDKIGLMANPSEEALRRYRKPKDPRPDDPALKLLRGASPTFIGDVRAIVEQMQSAGSRVVLITLPGLYSTHEKPTEKALEIGHLPTFVSNPLVLAGMAEAYNQVLRDMAKQRGALLVDLEMWSEKDLQPRDQFFFDAVHLYEPGQEKIGKYLADALEPMVESMGSRRKGRELAVEGVK
jgi:lysophospholipase L1-like esterase